MVTEEELFAAAEEGDLAVVRRVVDGGANVNAKDGEGRMTLVEAAANGHLEVVKFLVSRGAHIDGAGIDGQTALIQAAAHGQWGVVRYLVECGADVNAAGHDRETALMWSALWGHLDAVAVLVEHGADVNAAGNDRWTALMKAAARREWDVVKFLVEHGADVNATGKDGQTALIWAATGGRLNIVKYLVERSADVNATDYNGETALMKATRAGRLDIIKFLVEYGADVNAIDISGWTALILSASNGRLDVVQYLGEHGADTGAIGKDGETALTKAAGNGHLEVVKYFMEHGDAMAATHNDRCTVLILAASNGRLSVVEYLVEHGADVNTCDSDGRSVLIRAAENGHLAVVKYLIDRGADENATDRAGDTAFIKAASNGRLSVVKFFVERGAGATSNVLNNETALSRAAESARLSVVKYLLEHGTDANSTDKNGDTVLIRAAESGRLDVVKCLIDSGADSKIVNRDGFTAATVAARKGYLDIHRMLTRYESRSILLPTVAKWDANPTTTISSSHSDLVISPFDLDVTKATDASSTAADFIATWLDAPVALKLFISDAANTPFYDEVTLWHQLRHPNVLKLYGACDVGHHLFVCELASKGSVVEYLQSCLPEYRRPWRYLHHAALGLAYLHERGIIHGDLRGSNILMGDDDQAKLANFGLSGSSGSRRGSFVPVSGNSRGFVGSMRWQSPELLKGGKPSQASDVYALGLCVVEMLTREIPWHAASERWVRSAKHYWDPVTRDRDMYQPAEVLEDVRQLLAQLCCLDPTLRPPASACVRLFGDFSTQERDSISPTMHNQSEQNTRGSESWHNELATQWAKLLGTCKNPAAATTKSDLGQSVIDDLVEIYDIIQETSPPQHVVEKMHFLLQDTTRLVENANQTTIVTQLSSMRATTSALYALRRRITDLKTQLGICEYHDDDAVIVNSEHSDHYRSQVTPVFMPEISKTMLILDELETTEELAAFLAYLYSEINRDSTTYTDDQRELMMKTYNDLKSRLDASGIISTNLPVWFIPWYELADMRGKQIGNGGFGSVHLAKWLDSDVVVKRLESLFDGDIESSATWAVTASFTSSQSLPSNIRSTIPKPSQAEDRRMFEEEANIWFKLSHPHVVRLFGACHVGRQPFFVCEYASSGSLDKYLAKHPDEIWKKLHEAALGLLYLHERGIVHCDLKCNNIVVGSDKKAKVTDFGLSLAASVDGNSDSDKSGNITGAWHWLAPELMLGETATPSSKSDVFSFGMCIVEALRVVETASTKPDETDEVRPRVPWKDLDRGVVKYLMKRSKLPDRPAGCTDAQWQLVEKMCKFNPRERIQICTVVDELSMLAGIRQQHKQQPPDQSTSTSSQLDVPDLTSSTRSHITHERDADRNLGSLDKIYQIHELLWTRVEDILTHINGDVDALHQLREFAVDAQSRLSTISTRSDSLIDFTELALQGYGLHRRLDKLLAAAFVNIGEGDDDDDYGSVAHPWKRKCYEILGVESSVAELLLSRFIGAPSGQEASAA